MQKAHERILIELIKRFKQYRDLGEKTLIQLTEPDINLQPNPSTNSIAIIIQHLHGNMKSRFTEFLTTDGEKKWRKRDVEFESNRLTYTEVMNKWNEGWDILFHTLNQLNISDLDKQVYIRKEPLTVTDALFRQLAHYAYHVGQIVQIGKSIKGEEFLSLSIPIGQSQIYNNSTGIKDPANQHFPKNEL